jgi:ribose transport system permease protein
LHRSGAARFLIAVGGVLAALLVAWALLSQGNLTVADWSGFVLAMTPLAIAAMVQTVPILAGGQGLAAGATTLLVDVVVGTAPIEGTASAVLWIAVGLATGGAIGLANGFLIGRLRVPSTGVTYAIGAAVGALAFWLAARDDGLQQPPALGDLLFGPEVAGLPLVPILLLAAMAAGGVALHRARFGRALRVTGARLSLAERRLPAARLRCLAYVIAGLGYAVSGILLAGQVGALDSMLAMPILLQIFAAAALGGSCPGLRAGSATGALIGAAIVTAAANLFIPVGIPDVLSPAVDAGWLLLGLAACRILADRPAHAFLLPAAEASSARARATGAVGVLLVVALAWARPEAGTLVTMAAGIGLLAIGQGAVIRSGGFDLSMPALVSFAGLVSVAVSQGSWPGFCLAVAIVGIVAVLLGLWHALLSRRLGRGIVLATLASAGVLQAVAAGIDVWSPTGFVPLALTAFVSRTWLGMPLAAWLMLPVAAAAAFARECTWRRGMRDPRAAYGASALAAAAFGVLTAAIGGGFRLGIVETSMIPAVAGAVIGGVRFARGDGSLIAAFGATLIVQVADTLLVALGLSYEARLIAMAAAMLAAATLPQLRRAPER